jgi:hypothetical protein
MLVLEVWAEANASGFGEMDDEMAPSLYKGKVFKDS